MCIFSSTTRFRVYKVQFWAIDCVISPNSYSKNACYEALKWCRKRTLHCIILKDRTIQLIEEKKGKKTVIMGDVTLMTDII